MKPVMKLYYCKSLKSTGKPIVIVDMKTGKSTTTDKIVFDNVNIRMSFNNSTGDAKKSGATTVLEIWE